jgi:hypothetical protein
MCSLLIKKGGARHKTAQSALSSAFMAKFLKKGKVQAGGVKFDQKSRSIPL